MSILPSKPGAKVKRGDKRTPAERAAAMCERMASGKTLREAAALEGMSHTTFLRLCTNDPVMANLYAEAKEADVDAAMGDLKQQADRVMRTALRKGQGASAYVSAFSLKVKVALHDAEKRSPKRWGAKVEHALTGPNGGPMEFTEVRRTVVDPKAP